MSKEIKKILVVGGGGREHAIIKCLKRDNPDLDIYCAPGNGGIGEHQTLLHPYQQCKQQTVCQQKGQHNAVCGKQDKHPADLGDLLPVTDVIRKLDQHLCQLRQNEKTGNADQEEQDRNDHGKRNRNLFWDLQHG